MIRVLDKQIADKIAAGEVIERPVSIIKELVENAIDAGADSIVVEIKKGGKSYIRVTDNGCGIEAEEVEKAFLRHATSKISNVKDLDAIRTLGFRGEALASVCAVTRTELLTKRSRDKVGTHLIIHGGEVISNRPTGCPDGTTLIITDLFYNTPARQKFMKSDSAESGVIIDFMSQIALAYKDISFRLINNGNVLFSTTGDGNRFNVISRVFPNVDTKNLVLVKAEEGGLAIEGYISTPSMSRAGKTAQIFFVNGRVVGSKVIEKGLTEGYRERLFEGRHPVAFLFLEVDPSEIDVNIHPNKRAVRFDDEKNVEDFIALAVKNALGTKEAVVRAANIFKDTSLLREKFSPKYNEEPQDSTRSTVNETQLNYKSIMSTNFSGEERISPDNSSDIFPNSSSTEAPSFVEVIEVPPLEESPCVPEESNISQDTQTIEISAPLYKPFDFDDLNITGCIFNTYITAVDDTNFYLIDQHAAHERIFYEKLVAEYGEDEKVSQPILMPILIDVSVSVGERDDLWLPPLKKMGFAIESFGQNSYRISEIPTFMELSEAEDFAKDFIDNFEKKQDMRNTVIIDKLIMKSCKSAVKAHDHLSKEERDALIKDLKQCVNPFSCPHGRPTFIKLSNYEIERLFKRV